MRQAEYWFNSVLDKKLMKTRPNVKTTTKLYHKNLFSHHHHHLCLSCFNLWPILIFMKAQPTREREREATSLSLTSTAPRRKTISIFFRRLPRVLVRYGEDRLTLCVRSHAAVIHTADDKTAICSLLLLPFRKPRENITRSGLFSPSNNYNCITNVMTNNQEDFTREQKQLKASSESKVLIRR